MNDLYQVREFFGKSFFLIKFVSFKCQTFSVPEFLSAKFLECWSVESARSFQCHVFESAEFFSVLDPSSAGIFKYMILENFGFWKTSDCWKCLLFKWRIFESAGFLKLLNFFSVRHAVGPKDTKKPSYLEFGFCLF